MNCGSLHAFVTLNWVKVLYILAARDTIAMGLIMFIVLKAAVVREWILPTLYISFLLLNFLSLAVFLLVIQ